jgi:hypothetical protein
MKQTAVEWFMDKIGEKQPNGLYVIDTLDDVQNIYEQAKQMEKEQHEDTWLDSRIESNDEDYIGKEKSFQQYYEQTYGGSHD